MSREDREVLLAVYREAGEQIRTNNILRNTFLSFFIVALAEFIGLLARSSDPKPTELLWLVPALVSLVCLVSIWVTSKYIFTSLFRQDVIVKEILDP